MSDRAVDRQSSCISDERLTEVLTEGDKTHRGLRHALNDMVKYRKETIFQLRSVADRIDKRRRNANFAKAAGGALTAAGAITLLLVPGGGLLLIIGGTAAGLGYGTVLGASVVETVLQKVDLQKVQEAVDRDAKQCKKVCELWKNFEANSKDIIDTIALADPAERADINSLRTWARAIKENSLAVAAVAEIFSRVRMPSLTNVQDLCSILGQFAAKSGLNPSSLIRHFTAERFNLLCSIVKNGGLGLMAITGVVNMIISLIDLYNGSQSSIAHGIRGKADELKDEMDTWLDIFRDTPPLQQ